MSAMLDSVVHLIKGLLITDKQSESEFTTYALASGMSHDTFEWEFKGKAYNITILHEAHTMLLMDIETIDRMIDIVEIYNTKDPTVLEKLERTLKYEYKL